MKAIVVRQPWASLIAHEVENAHVSTCFSAIMGPENEGAPGAIAVAPERGQHLVGGAVMQDDTCSVDTCPRPAEKRGWCGRHYQRWWKYGDPLALRKCQPGEQFATLVAWVADRDRSECWVWPYSLRKGYGVLRRPGSATTEKAHRLAYELDNGAPLTNNGCHRCDTPACCNPDHIFDGTQAENMRDAKRKGRLASPPVARNGRAMSHKVLTPAAVRSIRSDVRVHRVIAAEHGVSPSTVSEVKSGRKWGWVK